MYAPNEMTLRTGDTGLGHRHSLQPPEERPQTLPSMMRAARMHQVGQPMVIEDVPVPVASGADVLVRVEACNIVPNLANILVNRTKWFPQNPLPALPAIFGLDAAGVIERVGPDVVGFSKGDRVYVNPGRHCGGCFACRGGDHINCESYAFAGYFGFTSTSTTLLDRYPYGGLAEYMLVPQYSLVKLPPTISFEHGSRFGYLGTAYSALRKADVGPTKTVLINGASGTLGLGAVILALAMGARRVFGTGRNREILAQVQAIDPHRIETFCLLDGAADEWVRNRTGHGVDVSIDALASGAPHEGLHQSIMSLRRGGRAVNIGGTRGMAPLDVHHMMDQQLILQGSVWFTPAQGQEMAWMVESGLVNLDVFENVTAPLDKVNEAISGLANRHRGGFGNFTINPQTSWPAPAEYQP